MPPLIFREGLDLKQEVAGVLSESYHSELVTSIKEGGYCYASGRLMIHLAREFGFCYGVDRAVDYAYQTRKRFPDRPVMLTGEIIHNPHVNEQLRAQGIRFLTDPAESIDALTQNHVVILPAFGVTLELLQQLDQRGLWCHASTASIVEVALVGSLVSFSNLPIDLMAPTDGCSSGGVSLRRRTI